MNQFRILMSQTENIKHRCENRTADSPSER